MKKDLLFDLKSPYRANFQIHGYRFGTPGSEKSTAIVGTMRGDEAQQQFIASQLVKNLSALEMAGQITPGREILVVPTANPYSLNSNSRFWALDGTDINRMFPGYDKGETTQRIAAALFEAIKGYTYGIQLASFYLHGDFIPHVRVLKTGYENVEAAKSFALPYVLVKEPTSFDTVLLNYNWQVFGTAAFALYSGTPDRLDIGAAHTAWTAVLHFLAQTGTIASSANTFAASPPSRVVEDAAIVAVTSTRAGILYPYTKAGASVKAGDILAHILDPNDGTTRAAITSPASGTVFYAYQRPLVNQNTLIYRVTS